MVAVAAMVAAVAVVAAGVAVVAVVVAVAVAVYGHVGLDRLDRPCPLQLPAKYPVGPQLGGALCTHTQCASLPHPQQPLPLLAASLPPVLQLLQLCQTLCRLPLCLGTVGPIFSGPKQSYSELRTVFP